MGRRATESESQDWNEAEDDEGSMDLHEDFDADEDEDEEDLDDEPPSRSPRPSGAERLMARRRIEQAREQRELSRQLADLDDYPV